MEYMMFTLAASLMYLAVAVSFLAADPTRLPDIPDQNEGVNIMRVKTPANGGKGSRCIKDLNCSKKDTCNLYTRKCEKCVLRGSWCRRAGNCCDKRLTCNYGICSEPLQSRGYKGHLCKNSNDCKPGLCCAKYHGVSVCQHYQGVGDSCSLPEGSVEFSVRHSCPCLHGLNCAMVSADPNDLRCVLEIPGRT